MRAVGIGELLARLERLSTALAAEGLFAAARKRPLPFLPATIGLICGRESAAERDVLRNAARRWPAVQFRVEEVAVQGTHAAGDVIAGPAAAGRRPGGRGDHHRPRRRLDRGPAAVLGRGAGPGGGGHAVTPVISAIGHEQDVPAAGPGRRRAGLDPHRRRAAGGARRGRAAGADRPAPRAGPAEPGGPAGPGAAPGWQRSGPGRRWPARCARSTAARSRSWRSPSGPGCRCRRAWPGPATTSRTPGPGWWRSPRPRRCAAVTRSSSATDAGVVRAAASLTAGQLLTVAVPRRPGPRHGRPTIPATRPLTMITTGLPYWPAANRS